MVEADPDWRTLLSAAHSWLAAGRAVAIATVASAWGSAPRRVGAQMVIDEQGRSLALSAAAASRGSHRRSACNTGEPGRPARQNSGF
ncbi:XdhC family protein [Hankyongella ginsenosidimutans]|uniref:XdhC family protein n=1 Tax=Hankyongella ginsenosidimutans TaxID=1763828 RepID=UPI00319E8F55